MSDLSPAARLRRVPPTRRIVTALDLPDGPAALALAGRLGAEGAWVKVGLELFSASGPDLVRALVEDGRGVFLDLKLHDIPNTVAGAAAVAARLGVGMLTIHAAGGRRAIAAAAEALATAVPAAARPALLGVTVLTSLTEAELAEAVPAAEPLPQRILRLARLAVDAGCDGIVCSPADLATVRRELGPGPLAVTPGVRPAGAAGDDQRRVATPARAIAAGADFLVVGRPITRAPDPAAALRDLARGIAPQGEQSLG